MKSPFIIADIMGLPPMGFFFSVAFTALFIWLCIAQIRHMTPLMRTHAWTWPMIIREFFAGLGHRLYDFILFLYAHIFRAVSAVVGGLAIMFLLGMLRMGVVAEVFGVVAGIITWFMLGSGGGGGGGNQHERGRRFPTRRDV